MNPVTDNSIFQALGMTIVHSIWQVMAIYLIVSLVLYILRKSSADLKYKVLSFSISAIFVMSCLTFFYYHNKYNQTVSFPGTVNLTDESGYIKGLFIENSWSFAGIKNRLNNTLPYLVSIYLPGVLILSIRLIFNLNYIQRIRKFGMAVTDSELQQLFENLKERILPGKNSIRLIESALIKVPIVFGHLKPLVIVPVGIFTQIPYNQLEAILAHKLAHIKRHDFLINILQSLVEILLFYHPLIYVISNRMRSERENCCDDFALDYCSSTQYAKALVNMETLRNRRSIPALAFVKQKEHLLKRVQRILNQEKMKTKLTERLFAALIILTGFVTIILTGSAGLSNHSEKVPKFEFNIPVNTEKSLSYQDIDTSHNIDKNTINIIVEDQKGEKHDYRFEFINDQLSALFVDQVEIPEANYSQYEDLIQETLADINKSGKKIEKTEKIEKEEIKESLSQAKEDIDKEEIRKEIIKAKTETGKSLENFNIDSVLQEVLISISSIPANLNIDTEQLSIEIKTEVENALEQIKNIDTEEISKELEDAKVSIELELEGINFEEIQQIIEEALEEIDIEKINDEMNKVKLEIKINEKNIKNTEADK